MICSSELFDDRKKSTCLLTGISDANAKLLAHVIQRLLFDCSWFEAIFFRIISYRYICLKERKKVKYVQCDDAQSRIKAYIRNTCVFDATKKHE